MKIKNGWKGYLLKEQFTKEKEKNSHYLLTPPADETACSLKLLQKMQTCFKKTNQKMAPYSSSGVIQTGYANDFSLAV